MLGNVTINNYSIIVDVFFLVILFDIAFTDILKLIEDSFNVREWST